MSAGPAPTRMGEVTEQTWTVIAADLDGVPIPGEAGKREVTRRVHFAWRAEVEAWLDEQLAAGWARSHGPTACATFYHGATDAPSNCWSAEVRRELTTVKAPRLVFDHSALAAVFEVAIEGLAHPWSGSRAAVERKAAEARAEGRTVGAIERTVDRVDRELAARAAR